MFATESQDTNNSSVYNPLIHGTNSMIFVGLRKTDFRLISNQGMLKEYGLAPLGGEVDSAVWGGGTDSLYTPHYISFGELRVKDPDNHKYGLEKILSSYTDISLSSVDWYSQRTREYACAGAQCGFDNINNLLINFSRAKQLGGNPLPADQYQRLLEDFNGIVQLYHFFMLLGKYIHPNISAYKRALQELVDNITDIEEMKKKYDEYLALAQHFNKKHAIDFLISSYEEYTTDEKNNHLRKVIKESFSFESFFKKINIAGLDIRDIYNNPTQDNLQKVLPLLEIRLAGRDSATQLFNTEMLVQEGPAVSVSTYDEYLRRIPVNSCEFNIHFLLLDLLLGKNLTDVFDQFEKALQSRIQVLNERFALLEKMFLRPLEEVALSPQELAFMKESFPVILVMSDNQHKCRLIDPSTREYRSFEPLNFGEDIKMIATDTTEHQLWIIKYLRTNSIKNVEVILMDQLKESLANNQPPRSNPYTNASGSLTFPFFAAMAAAHHEIKLKSPLVKDAEKYLKINPSF